jgi:hypothetical protein
MPHDVQVISEQECPRGWTYSVRIGRGNAGAEEFSEHAVRLDWAEHELWCGGRCPPSRVVEVLVNYMLEHSAAAGIPPRFDAATVRRWWPDVDNVLPQRL